MRGEFSRSTFSARMRYGSVTMQQGRVQLDTDWNEKSEFQLQPGLVYLDVWERNLQVAGPAPPLTPPAQGSPGLRMVREVTEGGEVSTTLHVGLGSPNDHSKASFALPELEVSVDGVLWKRVGSLSESGSQDRVYVIREDGDLSEILFGDGTNGVRPELGSRVVASYRFGGGGNPPGTRAGEKTRRTRTK